MQNKFALRSLFPLLGLLAACAPDAPAPGEAEPQAETNVQPVAAPSFEIRGPVALVDAPVRLRAQKVLEQQPGVVRLRMDTHGDVRTLAVYGDVLRKGDPVEMALDAVHLYKDALGVGEVPRDELGAVLLLDRVLNDDTAMHVRLRQQHQGIAMDDRSLDVHITLADPPTLLAITGSAAVASHIESPDSLVTEASIKAQATHGIAETLEPESVKASLRYIDVAGESVLAWRVSLRTPGADDILYYSAKTGAYLRKDERIQHGSIMGRTFASNEALAPREWLPMANVRVVPAGGVGVAQVTDANGQFSSLLPGDVEFGFSGPHVRTSNERDPAATFKYTGPADATLEFPPNDSRESEMAVFYQANRIHDFLKSKFNYSGMDAQLPIFVQGDFCNAYADPGKRELHFGTCSTPDRANYWDLALSGHVTTHEYVHLVADDIVKLQFSCAAESGAYGEGLSDYFACTVNNDPRIGADSHGAITRSCQNTLQYARDYRSGECHDGAFLFAGSMWDLRRREGAALADALAYWSMYYTPERPTLIDVRDAVLAADRARYAGANEQRIIEAFSGHGVNDQLVVFVTTDNPAPIFRPFTSTVVAHAQGFDRKTVSYTWQFDDGSSATGDIVEHTFRAKQGWARVTVRDANGTVETGQVSFRSTCSQGGDPAWLALVLAALFIARRRRA